MGTIKEVLEVGQNSQHIAKIRTSSGEILNITWRGLKKYWEYATYDDIEFISYSFTERYLVLSMTYASGQAGIIAIWDCKLRRWVQILEGDYVYCALLIEEYDLLVSLYYISNYMTSGHHAIFANKFEPTGGWMDGDRMVEIKVKWDSKSLNPEDHEVTQKAEVDSDPKWLEKCGPVGLFYSSRTKILYAHDACCLATIHIEDILKEVTRNKIDEHSNENNHLREIEKLNERLEVDPLNTDAWVMLGLNYCVIRNFDKAEECYTKALKINCRLLPAIQYRATTYYCLGKFNEALEDYSLAISIKPHDNKSYFERGVTYQEMGKYNEALSDFKKSIDLGYDEAKVYYNMGTIYHEIEDYDKAMDCLKRCLKIKPNDINVLNNIGIIYCTVEEYEEALKYYNKALQQEPQFIPTRVNRAETNVILKNLDEALTDYNYAVEVSPEQADLYIGRGAVYQELNMYRLALLDYNKAIELNRDDYQAYYNRGLVYGKLDDYQKAIDDFKKSVEINPEIEEDAQYQIDRIALKLLKKSKNGYIEI